MRLGLGSYYHPADDASTAKQIARVYYLSVLGEYYPEMMTALRDVYRQQPGKFKEKRGLIKTAKNEEFGGAIELHIEVDFSPGEDALLPWRESLDWLPKPPDPGVTDEEWYKDIRHIGRVMPSIEFNEWIFEAARNVLYAWEKQGVETNITDLDLQIKSSSYPLTHRQGPRKGFDFNVYRSSRALYENTNGAKGKKIEYTNGLEHLHPQFQKEIIIGLDGERYYYLLPENSDYSYDPYRETRAEAKERIMQAFERSLEHNFDEVEEAYRQAGWKEIPYKKATKSDDLEHFRWLYHVHVLGCTQKQVADKFDVSEVSVSNNVRPLRSLIFYPTE